jgi:phage terminase large subunit-like protein
VHALPPDFSDEHHFLSAYDQVMEVQENDRLFIESYQKWINTARPNQIEPQGTWRIWLLLAGRGFGKTRTAAEATKNFAWAYPGARIGVFAATFADGRDICFEGESGLCAVIPASCIKVWNRSIGEMVLTNGSSFRLFSAEDPDKARGHQFHYSWSDELASYKGKISKKDAVSEGVPGTPRPMLTQIELCTRLRYPDCPHGPRIIISTTPRPLQILKEILKRASTVKSTGSTMENAEHLAPEFLQSVLDLYEGTRLGRQELNAELLEDVEGALWTRLLIDDMRANPKKEKLPTFKRIVVAVDPAVTANKRSSETGIVVLGLTYKNVLYVLQDYSGKFTPDGWASETLKAYRTWKADCVVAEKNQGGELVRVNLKSSAENLPIKLVNASKGKIVRAEPVARLYEQRKVVHWGVFPKMEDQMCLYTGEDGEESPDRLDALVWGATELMLSGVNAPMIPPPAMAATNYWAGGSDGFGLTTEEFITSE